MLEFLWLCARGQRHQQFTTLENLKTHNPKLAFMIELYPELFWDGSYCYHLTAGSYIIRWLDFLPREFDYEKYKKPIKGKQKRLLE